MDLTKFCYGCDASEKHIQSVWEINNQTIMALLLTHKITQNASFNIKKTVWNYSEDFLNVCQNSIYFNDSVYYGNLLLSVYIALFVI